MKAIIFLGSNKSGSSYEAIRAADGLGYYTILLTDRLSFIDKRLEFPHAHSVRLCDLDDLDEVKSAVDRLKMEHFEICAIVSFIDPYCHTAAVLSHIYDLKCFSEAAILSMLDKVKSREALSGTPYAPFFRAVDDDLIFAEAVHEMPLVLKSPVSSGSKDVHLAGTIREYQEAFNKLRERYPDTPVLVEKYIKGKQYLIETLTVDGKVHVAAVVEQEITFTGRFIVTGYKMVTADRSGLYRSLKKAAESVIHSHGMQDGPCHLEFRQLRDSWKLIEANPRISGGAMNSFVETAYGLNLAQETIKYALGFEPSVERKFEKECYLQYIVVPKRGILQKVTGRAAAQNSPGVKRVYVKSKKGSLLVPPVSMGHRYAYVIATGASAEEAGKNAKTGASKIKFHLHATDNAPNLKGLYNFSQNVVFEAG